MAKTSLGDLFICSSIKLAISVSAVDLSSIIIISCLKILIPHDEY